MNNTQQIRPENYFLTCDGSALKSINELISKLSTIDDNSFSHHVNESRNDFSNWIKGVFDDTELADEIQSIRNKHEMKSVIEKRIFRRTASPAAPLKPVKASIFKRITNKKDNRQAEEPKADSYTNIRDNSQKEQDKKELERRTNELKAIAKENEQLKAKLEEIFVKEKEIEKREQKIEEIETRIEGQLAEHGKKKFFSKEFVQGLAIGVLISAIAALAYVKLVLGYY